MFSVIFTLDMTINELAAVYSRVPPKHGHSLGDKWHETSQHNSSGTYISHHIYRNICMLQDRLSALPPVPGSRVVASVSDFQPPYFPPPFTVSAPAPAPSPHPAPAPGEVLGHLQTPVSLQHLQAADPYQVTTTSLHSFSPSQVGSDTLCSTYWRPHNYLPRR